MASVYSSTQKEVEKFNKSNSERVAKVQRVGEALTTAVAQCDGRLADANVDEMSKAVEKFDENNAAFQDWVKAGLLDEAQYKSLLTNANTINRYIPLCGAVQDAVDQMGKQKFDKSKNAQLKKDVTEATKTFGKNLGKDRQQECNNITKALDDQERAHKSLKLIIENIQQTNFAKINVEESIKNIFLLINDRDNVIKEKREGKDYYNSYYESFNKALDDIREKAPKCKTKEELDKFLNSILENI